jgi:uncharacterized protein (TIGR00369 family)
MSTEARTAFTAANPAFRERIAEKFQRQYFMHHLEIELSRIEPGYVEASAPLRRYHQQQDGYVHGGMTSTLADVSTGFAAFSLARADQRVVTAELSLHYFKPGHGDSILARGWVTKPGSRLYFCEGEVWCLQAEKAPLLIAKARAVMAAFVPSESALQQSNHGYTPT